MAVKFLRDILDVWKRQHLNWKTVVTRQIFNRFFNEMTLRALDLIKIGIGQASFFGLNTNIGVLCIWIIVFIFVGQMFHKIIMKRE